MSSRRTTAMVSQSAEILVGLLCRRRRRAPRPSARSAALSFVWLLTWNTAAPLSIRLAPYGSFQLCCFSFQGTSDYISASTLDARVMWECHCVVVECLIPFDTRPPAPGRIRTFNRLHGATLRDNYSLTQTGGTASIRRCRYQTPRMTPRTTTMTTTIRR